MEREITTGVTRKTQSGNSPAVILKKILSLCTRYWYWFVISLIVAMGAAWFYLQLKPPVYQRSASIMIKQNGGDAMDYTMRELGISQPATNLVNEILLMRSSVVASEVVNRLKLDVDYFEKGTFYDKTLYGLKNPLSMKFCDLGDNDRAGLEAEIRQDSTIVLSSFSLNGQHIAAESITMHSGDTIDTPLGRVTAQSAPNPEKSVSNVIVQRSGINTAANNIRGRINASLQDRSSSIIDIRYRDVSRSRADDILNTLITVYNEQWMKNRNKQIVSTNEFIRDRLAVIENELGSVDKDISSYKSDNLILDIAQAGSLAMGEATESAKQEADIAMRIGQLRITYEYLSSATDDSQQIPLYSSIENGAILQRISEYNKLVLERNSHQSYSSAQNPLVVELNKQLAIQRKTIIDALSNEISTLQTQQNALRATHRDAIGRVARNPQQANYLLSVERQQKVKESLYLFLLQKREENELSQAFTAYNTQLIEPAHGSWDPVEPVSRSVYLMALILGLALPAVIIFLKEMLTTTVQGREDFKNMQIPFAGVIPQSGKKNRNKKKSRREPSPIVVKEGNRDMMNEAFRVIRSNLEFLLGHDASHKVIMLTSIDPGSGKTFITANLANTISLKEKKVLAIDLDLRRASLSACVKNPSHGISGYLAGRYQDYHELIVKLGEVDMLPCGALPPNPSELLYSDRFAKLMESVRQEYDYVFLDCPPLEIVADPAIINRYSDLTLFVARCGVLEKSLLPEIDEWYRDKKFNNMVVLLNGADANGGHYGYHHYGYHSYGYHSYGYYGSKS